MHLSRSAFDAARAWVARRARPIDQCLMACHFEEGDAHALVEALAGYQNLDGGFAHGLEPDFRSPESNALDTTVAFQYLRAVGAEASEPRVLAALSWLTGAFDEAHGVWRNTSPLVNEVPRAPWWQHSDTPTEAEHAWFNPSSEVVACLLEYASMLDSEWVEAHLSRALESLRTQEIDGHDLLCVLRLARVLDPAVLQTCMPRILEVADKAVVVDPEGWDGYGTRPFQVVEHPDDLLAAHYGDVLEYSLDHEIARQDAEGCWSPFWSWPDQRSTWAIAENDWRGFLTVRNLILFDRFGRIERE